MDLASLYEQIVRRHVPLQARKGEGLADLIARFHALEAKGIAFRQLENRMAQEIQFNRKVEMNRQLRQFQRDLQDLS